MVPWVFLYIPPDHVVSSLEVGKIDGGTIFRGIFVALAIVFGRIACGWVCPWGAVQELSEPIANPTPKKIPSWIKYAFFFTWLVSLTVLMFRNRVRSFELAIAPVPLDAFHVILYFLMFGEVVFFCAWLGRRSACKLCPLGAVMALASPFRRLRIEGDKDNCKRCGTCAKNCSMNLPIPEQIAKNNGVVDFNCILCGKCVESCPNSLLHYRLK
jgi:polyferredoxin